MDREARAAYAREWRKRNAATLKQKKRDTYYKKIYGLTERRVLELKEKQGNACALCGATDFLHLEHCHTSGVIRGFVCNYCNMCLGWVERIGVQQITTYLNAATLGDVVDMTKWQKKHEQRKTAA